MPFRSSWILGRAEERGLQASWSGPCRAAISVRTGIQKDLSQLAVKLRKRPCKSITAFCDVKQGVNEGTRTEYIAFRQPVDLSFADHVHRVVTVHGESPHFEPI